MNTNSPLSQDIPSDCRVVELIHDDECFIYLCVFPKIIYAHFEKTPKLLKSIKRAKECIAKLSPIYKEHGVTEIFTFTDHPIPEKVFKRWVAIFGFSYCGVGDGGRLIYRMAL